MIMIVNNTCVRGNDTTTCSAPGSSTGLAVGLSLFFLLLVIIAGVIIYKYHSKIRNTLHFGQRSQKKEAYRETPQHDSHQYISTIREKPTGHSPIYENVTTQTTERNRPAVNKNRFPSGPEEDVYLQCDSLDDAIYGNDPVCNLSILPNSQEDEDVYIVPDSL